MTIVPNRTPAGERWLRFIVENCDSVAVRDPESLDHLRAIGCEPGQWEVLADPAFALEWSQSPLESKRVALSVRFIHAGWGGLSESAYLDRMADVVRALQARGREVVGIPHQFYGIDQPNFDDRVVLSKIAERAPFEFVREPWLDLDQYRDFYAGCEALVGIRRHSFLFAAAAGVPVLAFAENPNASRACRDFDGHAPLGLDIRSEDFERCLDAFLDSKSTWRDRQNAAFLRQADGLAGRYGNALFGPAQPVQTDRLDSVLASQNAGCPA
jgi:polysaccharide pyruvyl transferase WcaK-like protein